ncbi:hypothetical protein [Roseateles sp.]|uniref:hypothetical protein n=1 Tax=Roseateles sp. TaxID=1971397 RepID=UPI0039E7C1BF
MPPDATLHTPLAETRPHRHVWSLLTCWWSSSTASHEAELGYESALPWTLGDEAPPDLGETR